MSFWEQAVNQAGREVGARYWRWFLAGRIARHAGPAVAVIVVAALLLIAYRLVAPDWNAVGRSVGGWAPTAAWAAMGVGAGALVLAVLVRAAAAAWNRWGWQWWLRRPW